MTIALTVYVSPTGSDANDGLTPLTEVKTLARVQAVIVAVASSLPEGDVEVRIRQGLYVAPRVTWNTFLDGRYISFMPIDYVYGMSSSQFAGRPIFRADGPRDWWMYAQLPSGHPGGDTLLRFYYLQVEQYNSGLMLHGRYVTNASGVRVPATVGANGNTVYGMNFLKLGTKFSGSPAFGVAGVDCVNSSRNVIRVCHFRELENLARADWSHLHAVYLAHGSSGNYLINNEFKTISGSGVDIRNGSNDTVVTGNTFDHVGLHAALSHWACDGACVTAGGAQECPSHGTLFDDNVLGVGYDGAPVPSVELTPAGNTYTGSLLCPTFDGECVSGNNVAW